MINCASNNPIWPKPRKSARSCSERLLRDTDALGQLAVYEAKSGDFEKARPFIGQALAIAPKDVDVLNNAVEVYTLAGEQQKALDCLKSAVQGGYPRFELGANPELASLRNDPRYRDIMAEAKTPR